MLTLLPRGDFGFVTRVSRAFTVTFGISPRTPAMISDSCVPAHANAAPFDGKDADLRTPLRNIWACHSPEGSRRNAAIRDWFVKVLPKRPRL